ncbi:hypothetical protein [Naumannella halotolerans]|uniref:Uncharacterized protein n=1 Tax=Naumannella halotolerans TaxID=993414 RepID=A0A4R7J265_9ACTN|nr:hypothetical protein [Naumannella halotolerans]TDT31095.1 hypothetical protein CLV29_2508 [Naumannella halotolerans]
MTGYTIRVGSVTLVDDNDACHVNTITGFSGVPRRRPLGSPLGMFEPMEGTVTLTVTGDAPAAPGVPTAADLHVQLEHNVAYVLAELSRATVQLSRSHPGADTRTRSVRLSDPIVMAEEFGSPIGAVVIIPGSDPGGFWVGPSLPGTSRSIGQTLPGRDTEYVSRGALAPNLTGEIVIVGPVSNPEVVWGDGYLWYSGAVAAGDVLRINAGTRQVSLNGAPVPPSSLRQVSNSAPPGQLFVHDPARPLTVRSRDGGSSGTWQLNGRYRYF